MIQTQTHRVARGSKILVLGCALAALIAAWLVHAASPAHASTTFTVNSVGDKNDLDFPGGTLDGSSDGKCFTGDVLVIGEECTLRAAIQEANKTPGADTIKFDVPTTGVATIAPASQLPTITGAVTIDGYSQPGAEPNAKAVGSDAVLKMELSGAKTVNSSGLVIEAANSTVRGLAINDWQSLGLRIDGSDATGNKVTGNFIGTDTTGTQDRGNARGVYIDDAPGNTIGGTTAAARNVISGGKGDHGISIDGPDARGNQVAGNYIGTDASGTRDLGNDVNGISIESAPSNVVGGASAGARNVISGNDHFGVSIYSRGTKVLGNFIGTDATGTKDLGNSEEGVYIAYPNNTVGGTSAGERNVISGNDDAGVAIQGATANGNKVTGNYVGTDASGTNDLGNNNSGVFLGASNNNIGGASESARNVISGNGTEGVLVSGTNATGNRVRGNYVGTDKSGTADLGNGNSGVVISEAPNNAIGGTAPGARNVVSGNNESGIFIGDSTAAGNDVMGNYVGTDASGTKALENTLQGVFVYFAPDNTIGGATESARNVISGNNQSGVVVFGNSATGNKVTGNFIGTDASGLKVLGNNLQGVFVYFAPNNAIGGTTAGEHNVIAANGGDGVGIYGDTATGNRVLSNSIYANGDLGIDLSNDGITPNDPGDADTGPNNLQNFPVLSTVRKGAAGTTTVRGTLNSTLNATFRVQFFSNPKGNDEGKTFLGSVTASTDGSGDASFAFATKKPIRLGQNVTATATGPGGNSSEFSAPKPVVAS